MAAESARQKVRQQRAHAEEKAAYDNICFGLREYADADIDGHRITIRCVLAHKLVRFYVDETLFLIFSLKWHYSSCSCENVCEHETSSRLGMEVVMKKKKGDYVCYFPADINDMLNEERVAHAIAEVMRHYEYRDF